MIDNPITTRVGEQLKKHQTWWGTVAAANGFIYGIPFQARRVIKFNPVDKSMTHIGPDFGEGLKWTNGAITGDGVIYCFPRVAKRGILKIDTNTDMAAELDANLFPEQRGVVSCAAAALDGCIYFMPDYVRHIMKLDQNNNNAISSVGNDLGNGCKYRGVVVGIDRCIYMIPAHSKRIIKYDPINDITSFVGEEADKEFRCYSNGALGRDGCIYAVSTEYCRVLKIDTTNNTHCYVGNIINHDDRGWGDGILGIDGSNTILGIDGCIYWPPCGRGTSTLKYDPHSNLTSSLVGYKFDDHKWHSGTLASDDVIYCLPSLISSQVLAIDPLGELLAKTKANMQEHPEDFGSLFQTIEADEDSDVSSLTKFDLAVVKFGHNKVFEVLDKSMKPMIDYCKESNLYPFMIVALQKRSPLCAIHHLLRRDLSWVNEYISTS